MRHKRAWRRDSGSVDSSTGWLREIGGESGERDLGLPDLQQTTSTRAAESGVPMGEIDLHIRLQVCNALLMRLLDATLLADDLNHAEYFALLGVRRRTPSPVGPSEIGAEIGQMRGNMTRICDGLIKRGLIRRDWSAYDRRRVELSMTEAGIDLMDRLVPLVDRRSSATVAQGLSANEMHTLAKLLSRLESAVSHLL